MSDIQIQEWQVENSHRHYPLVANDSVPMDLIIDACLFLPAPVIFTSIVKLPDHIEVIVNGSYRFIGDSYVHSAYGKLLLGNTSWLELYKVYTYNVTFLETVTYASAGLSLQGLHGDILLDGDITDLEVSFPETLEFKYDCIQTINDIDTEVGNFILRGDACTNTLSMPGAITLYDACKPPCYDCNSRLVTGDVGQYLQQLKDRVLVLEQNEGEVTSNLPALSDAIFYFDSSTVTINWKIFPAGNIIKKIAVTIDTPFDGNLQIGCAPYLDNTIVDTTKSSTISVDVYDILTGVYNMILTFAGAATVGTGHVLLEYYDTQAFIPPTTTTIATVYNFGTGSTGLQPWRSLFTKDMVKSITIHTTTAFDGNKTLSIGTTSTGADSILNTSAVKLSHFGNVIYRLNRYISGSQSLQILFSGTASVGAGYIIAEIYREMPVYTSPVDVYPFNQFSIGTINWKSYPVGAIIKSASILIASPFDTGFTVAISGLILGTETKLDKAYNYHFDLNVPATVVDLVFGGVTSGGVGKVILEVKLP